ncbi:MAG TPA: hypothetical protein VM782_14920 [Stellaceae bacterium]|nr:hypothetical protein [Stellaceae bacterium]
MTELDAAAGSPVNAVRFNYPASAMTGDYLRAAAGLVPVGAILATVSVGSVAAVVLGGFAAIFGAFAIRTALRHGTSLEVDDSELRATGLRQATIPWDQLDRMRLAFYSTRRDRKSGWMQLELGAGRSRLSLDSRLDGFDQLVRHAAAVAAERNLELSEATAANLQALGIRTSDLRVGR